jgi:hypothetical protein
VSLGVDLAIFLAVDDLVSFFVVVVTDLVFVWWWWRRICFVWFYFLEFFRSSGCMLGVFCFFDPEVLDSFGAPVVFLVS